MEGNGSCRACFLRKQPRGGHPLSLLTAFAASSPKGTPLRYAENLAATTKSRPLEGRLPPERGKMSRSDKRGSVASPQAMTEGVISGSTCRHQMQKQPDRPVWLLLCL